MLKNISVIGGDLRQLTAARLFQEDGYNVMLYGFEKNTECEEDIDKVLKSEIIILPLPVSYDGQYINAPFAKNSCLLKDIAEKITPDSVVFGGQMSMELQEEFDKKGIKYCDYLKREELAIKNAIPTAEGAIEIAMSETPFTLHGSRCLVAGYGRIGKILSKMLLGIGAKVSVEARKYEDLASIESNGCEAVALGELGLHIGDYDIIFNTVPHMIFDEELLDKVRKDTLIIDLASRPGGVDFEAALKRGIKVIWALSLPGKVAPVSAGAIIKETIEHVLTK